MPAAKGTQGLFFFENNLLDSSGLDRTLGVFAGIVPFATAPTPPQGTHWAGNFSGSSLSLADDSTNAMRAKDYWVVETYINMASVAGANVLWSSYATQNRLQMDGDGSVLVLFLNGGFISASFAFVAGVTYLVTASYDGTTQKLYVDGFLVASGLGGGTWDTNFAPASPTVIGDFPVPVGIEFKGKLDVLRFMSFNNAVQVPTSFPVLDEPDAPDLVATAIDPHTVRLVWGDLQGVATWKIWRSGTASFNDAVFLGVVPHGKPIYWDNDLTPQDTWYYWVTA